MDQREHDKLAAKILKSSQYQELYKHPAFQDFLQWVAQGKLDDYTELVLEPDQRVSKTSTDTLRGRLQRAEMIETYLQTVMTEGIRASEKIAKAHEVT